MKFKKCTKVIRALFLNLHFHVQVVLVQREKLRGNLRDVPVLPRVNILADFLRTSVDFCTL